MRAAGAASHNDTLALCSRRETESTSETQPMYSRSLVSSLSCCSRRYTPSDRRTLLLLLCRAPSHPVIIYPILALPAEKGQPIGIWGQRHLRYLKKYRRITYLNLLTSGSLNTYLADIDKQAEDMLFRLVKQMADREGVTEQIKATDQMAWVGAMSNIWIRATEVVNAELIYT